MTNPECVEALVIALKDYTSHITIGEADSGGYNRFSIDEVMQRTGIKDFGKKYGIKITNLSHVPRQTIAVPSKKREIQMPFPTLLLDEVDVVVSAAVPKIHMNTQVSMTVKNLWGCIPEPSIRLRLHPYLDDVLFEIVKRLKKTIGVIDGRYGLNRTGPMKGDPVELNWLLMTNDLYAADIACCQLMQVPPDKVYYFKKSPVLANRANLRFNQDWKPFVKEKFYLKRAWTDYPGLWAFRSPFLSYLAYFSPLADLLHKILYLFREPFYDYDDPKQTTK